jgi:AraC-like DNA-binding protein
MLYLRQIPKPPLNEFVELFWLYNGYSPGDHKRERLMPDGSVELVINLREDESRIYNRRDPANFNRLSGAVVSGPQSNFFVIDTAQQASVIGIHFRPGGAFPFFRLPLHDLHNLHVSLEDLWGREAGVLRERLLQAATPQKQLQVLESCLLAQARKPLQRHRAVDGALALFRHIHLAPPVAEISNEIGISSRRLIQVFSAEVGLTPKLFCRVRRFQQALRLMDRQIEFDGAGMAADCGYFDQAHFIHDFKAFSGMSPTEYYALKTEHLNHVPIYE